VSKRCGGGRLGSERIDQCRHLSAVDVAGLNAALGAETCARVGLQEGALLLDGRIGALIVPERVCKAARAVRGGEEMVGPAAVRIPPIDRAPRPVGEVRRKVEACARRRRASGHSGCTSESRPLTAIILSRELEVNERHMACCRLPVHIRVAQVVVAEATRELARFERCEQLLEEARHAVQVERSYATR